VPFNVNIPTPTYQPFYSTPEGQKYMNEMLNLLRSQSAYGVQEAQKGLITSLSGRGRYQSGQLPAGIGRIQTEAQRSLEQALSQLLSTAYGAEAGRQESYQDRLLQAIIQAQRMKQEQYQFEEQQPSFWELLGQALTQLGSSALGGWAMGRGMRPPTPPTG